MLRGVILLLVLLPLAWACGGEEEEVAETGSPSRETSTNPDQATFQALLRSGAAVGRAASPLYLCPPQEQSCYRENGTALLAAAEQEKERLAAALAETDDECLHEAGALYHDALEAYAVMGRSAKNGDVAAAEGAFARTSEHELAYLDKLGDCGFSEGRTAEVNSRLQTINMDVLRIVTEMQSCSTAACVQAAAERLEARAGEGADRIDELRGELREVAEEEGVDPSCMESGLGRMKRSFEVLERTAVAVQAGDAETAAREGARSDRLRAQAAEELADCLA